MDKLADALFNKLPSGVGGAGMRDLTGHEMRDVMVQGAAWAVEDGYGLEEDLEVTEERGCLAGVDPDKVSPMAIQRGMKQLGSLGSGTHFAEVQYVEHIYGQHAAEAIVSARLGRLSLPSTAVHEVSAIRS